jgi:hypothetical protein
MKNNILFGLGCVFFLISCKKENLGDCFKSAGKTNSVIHDVANFTCIEASDKINYYLTQESNFSVKVVAGANLQNLIKTELDGETLRVVNNNKCNVVRGYKHTIDVFISAPYFKYILHKGIGVVKSRNQITQDKITVRIENSGAVDLDINTETFQGSVHGNGDLYLSGLTNKLLWNYYGTNYAYLSKLNINSYVYLESNSIGHAYVNAPNNGLMDVLIGKSGNVYYSGQPSKINLTANGKGKLYKQ